MINHIFKFTIERDEMVECFELSGTKPKRLKAEIIDATYLSDAQKQELFSSFRGVVTEDDIALHMLYQSMVNNFIERCVREGFDENISSLTEKNIEDEEGVNKMLATIRGRQKGYEDE